LKVQRDGSEGAARRNREILPLDEYLRIAGLPFKMSPEMMAETAFFGVHESSFVSVEQMMRKYLPPDKRHPYPGGNRICGQENI
jgi:hypothetical protein